jgi:magnesium-transporting ATPase (P-type)
MFISVYNLFYTSLPVLALGIFDQDVNDVNSLKYPKLFTPGHLNLLFNKGEFFESAMHGCITSCVLFFIPYGASPLFAHCPSNPIPPTHRSQPKNSLCPIRFIKN